MGVSLILTCAGRGERARQGKNKLLVEYEGQPLFMLALSVFRRVEEVKQFIVTASKADAETFKKILPPDVLVVEGGQTRSRSVCNALSFVTEDVVLIHDGARPFVSERIVRDCIRLVSDCGSAVPVLRLADTVIKVGDEKVTDYIGKDGLCRVQTPQGFKTELIKKAYALSGDETYNDDGEIYKKHIGAPSVFDGETENVKLTYPEDFVFDRTPRYGTGFDCHRLVVGRKLILGGVTIPHDKGLLGHSDADVLVHAVCDALLSALALRDIGYHFPDDDEKYKNADSMKLLAKVLSLIDEQGYKTDSVSAVIMAEKPKLSPYISQIALSLANALSIGVNKVGIGATTLEGLGFIGREEGICVRATAVLVPKKR